MTAEEHLHDDQNQTARKLTGLNEIFQKDPGGRGLLQGGVKNPLDALYETLKDAERAVLLTGFPVCLPDGRVTGETDGPSGTANIAWALEQAGASVTALADRNCLPQVKAAFRARGCEAAPMEVPENGTERFLEKLFSDLAPTHLITLERPGKAKDGHFYNMRGGVIDEMLTDTDPIMRIAARHGAVILSVGDGGNELGMGALRPLAEKRVPLGGLICADAAADIALVSGVSNWWGWGIAGVLSFLCGRDLLPSERTEREVLEAVIRSGGADGVTKKAELTVDALSLEEQLAVLRAVRETVLP